MEKYKLCISSPPDRDKLVAEIFIENIQWVEINQEKDFIEIEFYPRPDGKPWRIEYNDAMQALNEAKSKLLNQ